MRKIIFGLLVVLFFCMPLLAYFTIDSVVGPHRVTQGHSIYLRANMSMSDTRDYAYVTVQNLPPNSTHDFHNISCCGVTNGVARMWQPGPIVIEVQTTPQTPLGNYTISVVVDSKGTQQSFTYDFAVEPIPGSLPSQPITSIPPIPELSKWESNMSDSNVAGKFCTQTYLNGLSSWEGFVWYYDGGRAYYNIADYLAAKGQAYQQWYDCGRTINNWYRDFVNNSSGMKGYRVFPHGLVRSYQDSGDITFRNAAIKLRDQSDFANKEGSVHADLIRETAYLIQAHVEAIKHLGGTDTPYLQQMVDYGIGHLNQYIDNHSSGEHPTFHQPFMAGLMMEALREYYEVSNDPRIPHIVKRTIDWLWDTAWIPSAEAFYLSTNNVSAGAPDISLLIVPAFGWIWELTGDPLYQQRGDQIFAGGVKGAWVNDTGKRFTQNYRVSTRYVQSRTNPNSPPPSPPVPKYQLTVANGSGGGSYEAGTPINISANQPPSGQQFDKWTGDTGPIADVSAANTTVTMPAAAVNVAATYKNNSTPPPPPSNLVPPEPPRHVVNTDLDPTYDRPADIIVRNDCAGAPTPCFTNFQTALDQVQPGQIVELKAGDVFVGNYGINNKPGNEWIYIRSSEYKNLPPPGTRVTPADAPHMAKLVNDQTNVPVLRFNFAAHHIRIIGLEMTTSVDSNQIVILGSENQNWTIVRATNINQLPDQIIFDRVYIHAEGTKLARAGIALDSRATAVIDSTIENIRHHSQDTQAIQSINGGGPFRIVNNKLISSGENLMFGGADVSINVSNGGIPVSHDSVACENPVSPSTCGIVPSDVEIIGNHFMKPLSWKEDDPSWDGVNGCMKNHLELKTGQRILMEGNIFENSWHDCGSQRGVSIKFKPTNQGGGGNTESANWDLIFRYNIIRNAGQAIALNPETEGLTQGMKRVHIHDNLVYDIGESWGSQGQGIFMPIDGQSHFGEDLLIENNTMLHEPLGAPNNFGMYLAGADDGWDRVHIRNNIFSSGDGSGWAPDGSFLKGDSSSEGKPALEKYFQNYSFSTNLLIRIKDNRVTPNYDAAWNIMNEWDVVNVGFVDFNNKDYRLAPSSPYKNTGTDQNDVGADIGAVLAATECVLAGTCNPPPTEPDPEDPEAPGSSPDSEEPTKQEPKKFKNIISAEHGNEIEIDCDDQVDIYDRRGNLVKSLMCVGGTVSWNGDNVPSGIYFVREEEKETRKVVVIK